MSTTEDSHAHAHHGPPPPPEPKTPMWLPAVGAALFLVVGLIWGLSTPSTPSTDEAPAGSAGAAPSGEDAGAPSPH